MRNGLHGVACCSPRRVTRSRASTSRARSEANRTLFAFAATTPAPAASSRCAPRRRSGGSTRTSGSVAYKLIEDAEAAKRKARGQAGKPAG